MILTDENVTKIMNSDLIKGVYPMIDHIKVFLLWDGDEEYPLYDISLKIYLNDPDITTSNMYDKGLDPHYLVDNHMVLLLKFLGSSKHEIAQVYIRVIGPDGKVIY